MCDTGESTEMNHHPESSEQIVFDHKRLNNRPLIAKGQEEPGMNTVINPRTFEPIQTKDSDGVQITAAGNYVDVERYQTYVKITNFREIPRIVINTPSFQFDGHGDTTGWHMLVNQRHFNGRANKTVVRLLHGERSQQEGVRIRPSGDAGKIAITSIDDVISMFSGDFEIVHAHRLAMGPRMADMKALGIRAANQAETIAQLRSTIAQLTAKNADLVEDMGAAITPVPSLDAFTDEELLAEVHRRTMAAIGDYRGSKRRDPVTLDNIINLDDVKRIRFDEERLRAVLAA